MLDACLAAVRPGGRVVATFAAADRALAARARLGALVQVSVDVAADLPDGGVRFVADNPVFVAWGDARAGRPARGGGDAGPEAEPRLAVGVGCSRAATPADVGAVIAEAVAAADGGVPAVVATIDRRVGHPAVAALPAVPLVGFPPGLLASVDVPHPSDVVREAVGTPSVAEAAALLAAGPGARLVAGKRRGATATAAVAVAAGPARASTPGSGRVAVVGLGPGDARHRTPAASRAVRAADAVIGYSRYVDAAAALLRPDQLVVRSAMGAEAERAEQACALAAAGWAVAVVSSGDPGTFAMASVTLEVAAERGVPVDVVPGVTAASAGAAAAGAPLAGPHVALTLSDLLIPWGTIEGQLLAAARSGLALALFNPRSRGRPDHLARARDVLATELGPSTAVAVVTAAGTADERVLRTTLADLDPTAAGMQSIVLVGTPDPVDAGGRLVTRRHHPRPGLPATSAPVAPAAPGPPAEVSP